MELTASQKKSIIGLYRNGHSIRETAKRAGVSTRQVVKTVKARGLGRTRSEAQKTKELSAHARAKVPLAKLIKMYEAGMTGEQIAAETGMTRGRVIRRLRNARVEIRRPTRGRRSEWAEYDDEPVEWDAPTHGAPLVPGAPAPVLTEDSRYAIHEYRFLRQWGLRYWQVAARLGYDEEAFYRLINRTGDEELIAMTRRDDEVHRAEMGWRQEHVA